MRVTIVDRLSTLPFFFAAHTLLRLSFYIFSTRLLAYYFNFRHAIRFILVCLFRLFFFSLILMPMISLFTPMILPPLFRRRR